MNWIEIGREESRQKYEDYCATGNLGFSKDYDELRKDLVDLFSTALIKVGITEDQISQKNYSYQLDLQFGLKLYTTLNEKYGMSVRLAATDGVWRYLCSYVAPDLVEKRYGKEHPDRIWKKPKRLWLRVLWWYIYLSWQMWAWWIPRWSLQGTDEKERNVRSGGASEKSVVQKDDGT